MDFLVDLLLEKVPGLSKVILFGSYARYEQKATSDLDILALTVWETPRETRGELCSVFNEYNADLIFYTNQSFESSSCLFVTQVKRDGILLWKS